MDEDRDSSRIATAALLLATLFWGCGFVWAKVAGETVNRTTGAGDGAALGPIWVLAVRFLAAALLWAMVFPQSRRGWTRSDIRRSIMLGTLLTSGMVVQHLGLDRTSEAVCAFLTSLTILFVPLMMTLVLRRPPAPAIWIGVIVAAIGVWLMTGASPTGFGVGEMLALACAVAYSIDIIAVGMLLTSENAARVTLGQFLAVGILGTIACALLPHGRYSLSPQQIIHLLAEPRISVNVALMAVFVSMCAFGLQFRFQPLVDPTRAALLYLVEPIFASLYAYLAAGRDMSGLAFFGGGLILLANLIVEILQSRKRSGITPLAAAVVD